MDPHGYTADRNREIKISCLKGLHFLLSVGAFYVFWLANRGDLQPFADRITFRGDFIVVLSYALAFLFFIRTYNGYLLGYTRIRDLALTEFFSQAFSTGCICLFTFLFWGTKYSMSSLALLFAVYGAVDVIWAYWANKFYYVLYPTKKAILVYRDDHDKLRFEALSGKPSERLYRIEEEICYTGSSFSEIRDRLEGYEAIFVAGIDSNCRNGIAKYCIENNTAGYFAPHTGDVIMQGAMHIQSFESPILYLSRKHLRPEYKYTKRLFDIVFSFLGLLFLSPFMLVLAAVIRLSDGGPALYKQKRLTINNEEFMIYKFRSMRMDAERDGVARLSSGDDDSRVTPIGRILRRYRLDEYPQLFNILKGDMSVVGPRPERPEIAKVYYETLPGFALRLQVKAGLTGYAQVYGRYNTDPYEKLQFDLIYINQMSFFTDIKLIFATLRILLSSRSTEGVEADMACGMKEEGDLKDGGQAAPEDPRDR